MRAREWIDDAAFESSQLYAAAELVAVFERHELPFAPITKPQELIDPHQVAMVACARGHERRQRIESAKAFFTLGGERLGIQARRLLLGEHTAELLRAAGYSDAQVQAMLAESGSGHSASAGAGHIAWRLLA